MRANFGRPLSGIRIVDLTSLLPGGIATRLLADLGAEVVKVEPPGGEAGRRFPPLDDGISVYYRLTAGGKKVHFFDLKTPKGRATLDRLLTHADVLIHSLRPGAARRLTLRSATSPHGIRISCRSASRAFAARKRPVTTRIFSPRRAFST